jgi:hypothetical protein
MKCILALLTLSLVPITVAAQQTERSEGERCGENAFNLSTSELIRCLNIQRQEAKEEKAKLDAKLLELKEKAEEAQKAYDDLKKLRSGDQGQQIEGLIGAAKKANSDVNNNAASKEVTEKSLNFMDQVEHQQQKLLDNVGKTIEKGFDTSAGSPSTFSSQGHQLVEKKGDGANLSLDDQIDEQQGGLLASPSTVVAVASADRAEQAKEQARKVYEAKEAAERRAALAAAERAVQQAKAAADKAEQDAEDAEDARLERRARANATAAARRVFYPPPFHVPYVPTYYAPMTPYPASYVSPISSASSSASAFLPQQDGMDVNYLGQHSAKPDWNIPNYFSCMSNLLDISTCIKNLDANQSAPQVPTIPTIDTSSAHQSAPQSADGGSQSGNVIPQTPSAQGPATTAR